MTTVRTVARQWIVSGCLSLTVISLLLVAACSGADSDATVEGTMMVSVPIIEGPITGPGAPFLINTSSDQALAAAGYEAREYFVSGTATSYRSVNDLPANGMWDVEPAGSAAYKPAF